MNKIKCVIIDDELLALKGLSSLISQNGILTKVAEFDSANSFMLQNHSLDYDLLFVDINMPEMSGIDLIQKIKKTPVIITTAYPEYALQGYELDVLDYLLKPISLVRFDKAVLKAKEYIDLKHQTLENNASENNEYIFVKCNKVLEKVVVKNILYIEALQNYIAIHTTEKRLIIYMSLKKIIELLPPSLFLKIHKSYIVNLEKIDAVQKGFVELGNKQISISRTTIAELKNRLYPQGESD